ncbi:MAG: hypothetical protein P9F19_11435 [Candidatus Contendobacter sp.]|nr:hypothetical protein [Candidatus Contendobacter sp.]MDG4557981.1 hypothetical protein [Candidatus Contendobacter sp.]
MYIADDPTLALITRFVGDVQDTNLSDTEFLLQQIAAIERYVAPFPDEERQERALEWIAAHARHYRQQWQKQAAVGALAHARCPDCPLDGDDRATPCAVHKRWLDLLRRYAAAEISSQEYVEDSLKLLGRYKNQLKVSRTRQRRSAASVLDPG